jgi:hypothetical protein
MKVALVAIAFASTSVAPAMAQDAKTIEVKPFEDQALHDDRQLGPDCAIPTVQGRAKIGTKYKFGGGTPGKGSTVAVS